nr:9967_t:CDS:2 [Entrophospora candida]
MSLIEYDDDNVLAVDVSGLNFNYGGPSILNNLNLQLKLGSRCLLVGANGAGKSTLLMILAGKRMVRSKVLVLGRDSFNDPVPGIRYLGTEWANNPTVKGDVMVSTLLSNMNGDKYPERRDELVGIMDINPKWRMHQLSDGQRRRVQLVLGLIEPWNILLMDEVTVDLDVLVRSDLLRFLRKESETRKATIIYATHIFDGLGDWPSHIAHMKDGAIITFHKKLSPGIISLLRRNMVSPLLKVVEQWLREDFLELKKRRELEKQKVENERDKVLLGEENPKTKWDRLSEDANTHGNIEIKIIRITISEIINS